MWAFGVVQTGHAGVAGFVGQCLGGGCVCSRQTSRRRGDLLGVGHQAVRLLAVLYAERVALVLPAAVTGRPQDVESSELVRDKGDPDRQLCPRDAGPG